MPAQALKYVTGMYDSAGAWRPLCSNWYHRLPSVPSASEKGHGPLLEGNWLHKFLRTAGFCLATSIWGNGVSFGRDTHLTERWFDDTEMCCPHV